MLTADDCNDDDATNTLTFDDPDCDFAPLDLYSSPNLGLDRNVNNGTYTGIETFSQGEITGWYRCSGQRIGV